MSSNVKGFHSRDPKMRVELDATIHPTILIVVEANGKPTMLPNNTSFGFLAYRWKSEALDANVAKL